MKGRVEGSLVPRHYGVVIGLLDREQRAFLVSKPTL